MPDDPMDLIETIRATIREEMHPHAISVELHAEQHEFITAFIAERKEKAAQRERIKEKIVGSVALSFILGLITLLGVGALDWIRTHSK